MVLEDWGLALLTDEPRRDLLELFDDRHGRRATLAANQLPIAHWHTAIGESTLADALLDRLVPNAYTIPRTEESLRKRLTQSDGSRPPRIENGGQIRSASAAEVSRIYKKVQKDLVGLVQALNRSRTLSCEIEELCLLSTRR